VQTLISRKTAKIMSRTNVAAGAAKPRPAAAPTAPRSGTVKRFVAALVSGMSTWAA
jgi:hypothetical protein